jgi:hypothetical protein
LDIGGTWIDWLLIVVTGAIAYHGITYRDKNGDSDWVRLLFACIALVFLLRTLFVDVLGLALL